MTTAGNLAKLAGEARRLDEELKKLRRLAADQPPTIQIEVNNLQEVLDFLRYKLRDETLRRAIHGEPPKAAALRRLRDPVKTAAPAGNPPDRRSEEPSHDAPCLGSTASSADLGEKPARRRTGPPLGQRRRK